MRATRSFVRLRLEDKRSLFAQSTVSVLVSPAISLKVGLTPEMEGRREREARREREGPEKNLRFSSGGKNWPQPEMDDGREEAADAVLPVAAALGKRGADGGANSRATGSSENSKNSN